MFAVIEVEIWGGVIPPPARHAISRRRALAMCFSTVFSDKPIAAAISRWESS